MANNLFVAYDLNKERDAAGYQYIADAIKKLGTAVKIQRSVWFVSSDYSCEQAAKALAAVMDANDYLVVIDARDAAATKALPGSWDTVRRLWTPRP